MREENYLTRWILKQQSIRRNRRDEHQGKKILLFPFHVLLSVLLRFDTMSEDLKEETQENNFVFFALEFKSQRNG
jgi:hypothetical protein